MRRKHLAAGPAAVVLPVVKPYGTLAGNAVTLPRKHALCARVARASLAVNRPRGPPDCPRIDDLAPSRICPSPMPGLRRAAAARPAIRQPFPSVEVRRQAAPESGRGEVAACSRSWGGAGPPSPAGFPSARAARARLRRDLSPLPGGERFAARLKLCARAEGRERWRDGGHFSAHYAREGVTRRSRLGPPWAGRDRRAGRPRRTTPRARRTREAEPGKR
jgi:hypothetical protein